MRAGWPAPAPGPPATGTRALPVGTVGAAGRTTAALQSPTGYTGIYSQWNVDLDGDSTVDGPWHFGTTA